MRLPAFALLLSCSSFSQPVSESFIFDPEKTSRGHVHASSIVELPNGDLLCVWYENGEQRPDQYYVGDKDKSDDVRIGGARRPSGKTEWEKPFVVADTFGVSDNNPSLLVDGQNRLWLVYPTLLAVPQSTWGSALLRYKVSTDYLQPGPPQWSRENILVVHPDGLHEVVARSASELMRTAGRQNQNQRIATALLERLADPFARRLGWMPRAHPVALKNGTVVLPFSNENFNAAAVALTRDGGETWTFGRVMPDLGVTQPSIVELPSGRLLAFMRDASGKGRIQQSHSDDGGLTWDRVTSTELINPGAGIEAIRLQSGNLVIAYNPVEKSPRDKLAISLSNDQGKTWKWTRLIESRPGERFDYPSVVQARDGKIHVTYTYNLRTFKHVEVSEDWIVQEK